MKEANVSAEANTKPPTLRELFCLEDGYDIHMVAVSVHDRHKPQKSSKKHPTLRGLSEVSQKSSKKQPTLRKKICLKDDDDDATQVSRKSSKKQPTLRDLFCLKDDDATEVSRKSSKKHSTLRELFCFQLGDDEDCIQMVDVSSPEIAHKPTQKLPTLRELLSLDQDDEAKDIVDCYLKSEADDHSSETLCYRRIFEASREGEKVVIPPRKSIDREVVESRKSWKKKIEEMIRKLTRFGCSKKKKEQNGILVETDLKIRMQKWEDQRKAKLKPNRGDEGHGQRSKSKRKREEWEKQLEEYLHVW